MQTAFGSWPFWAALSALFAALTAIFGKLGVEAISSEYATLLRTLILLPLLVAIAAGTGSIRPLGEISGRTLMFLALSGLATGASWLCYYRALKLGPASGVAPIDKLSVVLVALIGWSLLGERMLPRNWLGVAMIAGGAILVALRG